MTTPTTVNFEQIPIKLIDNFLPEEEFSKIEKVLTGPDIRWQVVSGSTYGDPKQLGAKVHRRRVQL